MTKRKLIQLIVLLSILATILVTECIIKAQGTETFRAECDKSVQREYSIRRRKNLEHDSVKPTQKRHTKVTISKRHIAEGDFFWTADELWLMAHIISGEAGCNWCSDLHQLYVGSVVLNRVNSTLFPNSIEEVIFQSGQYACTWDGGFYIEPTERCWENAKWILRNGSILPDNVVFQSQGIQGDGVYAKEQNQYFCYLGKDPREEE